MPGLDAAFATAESDCSLAVTRDAKAYSWGFSVNRQTGQGTDDDVECASIIDNTAAAVRGKKLVWAGAGVGSTVSWLERWNLRCRMEFINFPCSMMSIDTLGFGLDLGMAIRV